MSAYRTLNPATGKIEKSFETFSDATLAEKVDTAQAVWSQDWRRRTIADRAAVVERAAGLLRDGRERYARLISIEMGKVLKEAVGETALAADILSYYAKNAERFLAPRQYEASTGKATILRQPLGIIYCIEPWNFPYYQLARVAGPNLMAGNVVMVKHAPGVPQCAEAFAELFIKAGAPEGIYTNLFITNDQSEQLIGRPEIRGVALTGSERAGGTVAAQAGKALKKTTLELGGSDPFIVLDDADLDTTVKLAVAGRMSNNGQVCTASKRMIVHSSLYEEFTERLATAIAGFTYGDPLEQGVTHGPMSSEDAMKRALSQVEEAVSHGATRRIGAERLDRDGFFMQAGILTDLAKDNPVYYQEIFGPVAIVTPVDSDDEAVALANDSPYGLGGSVHTADLARGRAIAERIETGMVYLNGITGTAPDVPFGGVRNSGYGRELSELGIEEFLNHKLIHEPA
ncbi:succinate-semialdehyde dehydrogenase/glutarate-semialdehyde dehydrogenase [Endobacter medicaginis]|uniref:NAD-dependent succinate-semialdehyde dehydrogenase n=1 Tax=Endobacter medicaginis TaxID=1181271 RepID=A0A839UTT2_9PROT|nr:NAD-dependent succinate-semialdehyde dehydrogenase [Endobacter medicaginis]MBB3173207.1 succinate-semialdehyde dehydrogenase/glutarate-semialdehyde dehydrogenase [Endobacter medicaginis]MCX5476631.1 NAD-dependent succinate-semialdehyde dehydrogenase [Endobacter medicaginis]NVN29955.1 NAD-dependent succinate-semialdehyde dehydrogenase [Endobacter medicaginis]